MTMKYDRHGHGDDSDTNGNGNDDDDNFANQLPTKYVQYYQSFNHLIPLLNNRHLHLQV